MLNGPKFFEGNQTTYFNFAVSVVYLLLWASLSIYAYIKKELNFSRYMIVYWSVALVVSIIYAIIVIINDGGRIPPFPSFPYSIIISSFEIAFFAPFYGLELLLNLHITKYSVVIIVIPIIFITLGIIITRDFKRM